MRSKQFFHDIAKFRWTIFRHEAGVTNGQLVVFENCFGEIPIQDVPGTSLVRSMLLKIAGEQFCDFVRAATGLARDGNGEFRRRVPWRWKGRKDRTELGTDNRRAFIQGNLSVHILTS